VRRPRVESMVTSKPVDAWGASECFPFVEVKTAPAKLAEG
jgi:hypothetical protein